MSTKHSTRYSALVVGASGIIGNAVVRELRGRPDWRVRALPRTFVEGVETIKVDLHKVYSGVLAQTTDSAWMARASVWAALDPNARNEAFNLVNEPFRWERIWRRVAAAFDMEVGPPQPFSLARQMPLKAEAWAQLAGQHGLQTRDIEKLVGWWFGDFVFNTEFDMVSDMGKIRRAGFTEAVETEATILAAIERLRASKQLP
jgi:hypothetical protein